ncbi:MAG: hypothetical protein V3V57_03700 [Spirochaetia bacterium]|jgi:hypothetical protein
MADYSLQLDSKNRITLTKLLSYESVHSVRASVLENGDILLKPMVEIPASERWLYENKEALASVKRGLEQKETVDLGSFAQYAK